MERSTERSTERPLPSPPAPPSLPLGLVRRPAPSARSGGPPRWPAASASLSSTSSPSRSLSRRLSAAICAAVRCWLLFSPSKKLLRRSTEGTLGAVAARRSSIVGAGTPEPTRARLPCAGAAPRDVPEGAAAGTCKAERPTAGTLARSAATAHPTGCATRPCTAERSTAGTIARSGAAAARAGGGTACWTTCPPRGDGNAGCLACPARGDGDVCCAPSRPGSCRRGAWVFALAADAASSRSEAGCRPLRGDRRTAGTSPPPRADCWGGSDGAAAGSDAVSALGWTASSGHD